MLVVGGTYFERCRRPRTEDIYGSGLRAAISLKALDPSVQLVTGIDSHWQEAASAVSNAHGLEVRWGSRDEPVGFSYFTPISPPSIDGRMARMTGKLSGRDSTVLAFGMVEAGSREIAAETLVLDPQQPRELVDLDLSGSSFKRLAIVANAAEVMALGRNPDIVQAATAVLERYSANAVVVKRAALGAVIVTAETTTAIGAFRTAKVWPIGSGDVFAAGFAWAYGVRGLDPVSAARVGSLSAAIWCSQEILPVPESVADLKTDLREMPVERVTTYLAGPFFTLGQQWVVELLRDALNSIGADVFSPLHDVGRGGPEVAATDLAGLERCDSVLAVLDDADPGTWLEIGWARRAEKPVVGYCQPEFEEQLKMARGTGVEVHSDLATAAYAAIWAGMASK